LAFEVDVELNRGGRRVAARFASDGGIAALVGHSGAGKTSVLDMVAGLVRPDRGRIAVAGRVLFDSAAGLCLPPHKRDCGYVFQDHRLFPHLKVADNLLYGARARGQAVGAEELARITGFLGIGPLLQRYPRGLSGGEAQRVAIGRALLSGARFLLMDEPLASLDDGRREEIMTLIERIRDELAMPILYVSHDRGEVERLAQMVVVLGG